MKLTNILKAIEETMTVATFAEQGEHRTALELLRQQDTERKATRPDHAGGKNHLGKLQHAA